MYNKDKKKLSKSNAEKPISLKPYKLDEAVSDLLKVKPEEKNKQDKSKAPAKS